MLERLRQEHPQMAIIIIADDLYSRQPFIEKCLENRLHYVLVAKEESHPEMFEWVAELKEIGGCEIVERFEGAAGQRKIYEYAIVREEPLNDKREQVVNYVEVWERDLGPKGSSQIKWQQTRTSKRVSK
jgi:hypothetical protein